MESEAKNKRLISYALGVLFLCSLVSFALLSFKLVNIYNENRALNELMNRIIKDYDESDKDQNGYYLNFDSDEDLDIHDGKVIVSFPNTK